MPNTSGRTICVIVLGWLSADLSASDSRVSTFRSRLDRLRMPGASSGNTHTARVSTLPDRVETDLAALPTAEAGGGAGSRLEHMRAQMDALFGSVSTSAVPVRSQAPRVAMSGGSGSGLICTQEETDDGIVHVRRTTYGLEHRVGTTSMAPFRSASGELLGLLALDASIPQKPSELSRTVFFDTETTGLSGGAGTLAFLVGLGFYEGDTFVLEQYFLDDPGDEKPMLERVRARLEAASCWVSFNGKSFDAPLLRTRFLLSRIAKLAPKPHLDLLHVARRVHKDVCPKQRTNAGTLQAEAAQTRTSFRLGEIERRVLGFERVGDIPGSEVAESYLQFLRCRDFGLIAPVLEHNQWDILSMVALAGLYGEPLAQTRLMATDLPAIARTLQRAGALEQAHLAAEQAISFVPSPAALYARAEIARARGDRRLALEDLENLVTRVDAPEVRLRLARMYEHDTRDFEAALRMVAAGTGESAALHARRYARLEKKRARTSAHGAIISIPKR